MELRCYIIVKGHYTTGMEYSMKNKTNAFGLTVGLGDISFFLITICFATLINLDSY